MRESLARAMLQLPATAEMEINWNLRVDFPLLRLIKLHQGSNSALKPGGNKGGVAPAQQ